ncbi:uncharacterized protein LOC117499055 isoform X18 [Trematomus bernacchii]|uniref:uncharacterized protein LOC117499055 isoform X18 n=1 Tax=Trematomus bernacchii TaxID=40690 RepID=UPI001469FB15|nr:uncharacterized protein LOC117499055 isoform X18 [Trematomus bernacchii]
MASTTQSAVEYVRGARIHLVKTLKNHSVILENLKQQGVLRDEEVCRIQAEGNDYDKNRKLIDSVTDKGEKASYEFLKIIDMTRKRTHGRTSLFPEKQTVASAESKMFDLHHWISCFPFKEDTQMGKNYLQGPTPCHRYQAKLKSKAQKISKAFWTANKDLFEGNNKPDLSYMPLVLDTQGRVSASKIKKLKSKKSRMSRSKKLGTYIPKDKADISPSDLLKTDKNILLVGKSGIGKTALVHEMLKLWTEKDDKELNYMFYFDMRKISNIKSLEDLLFNEFSEPDEGKDEVLQDIKNNSDKVTLIFDGITDLSSPVVKRLVDKDLLKDSMVVLTCRPVDEDNLEEDLPSEDFDRVEVKGFSEQTIKTYISAMLREGKERVLSNVELLTLCHVPMYALMVTACFSFETSEDFQKPCCITDIYINIFRFCLKRNTKNIDLNAFIKSKSEEILSLAEVAFRATEEKTVNLTLPPFADSCVLSLLKQLAIKVAPTESITTYAFLHYTMQEFFAALWLLKNPDLISNVFQQCLTEKKKHMKHLIPYMCRLLTEDSPSLMKYLIPVEELKNTSNWFFKKVISTFLPSLCENDEPDTEDSGRILFLCQCLYESQCPEACIDLLEKLDYRLDLSGESLDPYPCCAVAYVITQSKEKKIWLNLEDVTISQQGMRPLLGCLQNVQWCDSLPRQLWKIFLLSEGEMDYITLLGLDGNQLHLPVGGDRKLFERAVTVLQKISEKVNICLHWERETPDCHSLCETLLEALPYVSSLSFRMTLRGPGLQDQERCYETLKRQEKQLFLDLCLKAATHFQGESVHNEVNNLIFLFSFNYDMHNILLDLYQHVKTQENLAVIQKLKPFFQSVPAFWFINLSKRKTSILLEVLRLQPEKKQVELRRCSDKESEVRTLLQCLPYISKLSFVPQSSEPSGELQFFGTLFCAAAEREQQTGEKTLLLLLSVCTYQTITLTDIVSYYLKRNPQCDFLLDLYSHLKDYETETGLSVLPSLKSVLQSAPAVWIIALSKRKSSILLEVLRLQPEKKQVELRGCSEEESEVRILLQCLPYISKLSYCPWFGVSGGVQFFGTLFCAAAEREQQTGEKTLELLSSVCTYPTFPLPHIYDPDDGEYQSGFLLDLYSHLKDYETESGLSVLPSLQSVLQSAPAVWTIDLSERKTSILLEVLRLQPEKKQVELTGCSGGESEVRTLLQCLPYISQLSSWFDDSGELSGGVKFFGTLFCAAAEREQQTGEKTLELLSSVCTYPSFPFTDKQGDGEYQCDFLLDLYSHLKDCETETGLSFLPSLQSVLQSAPAVWTIDLSERKSSILLEVLRLQPEKTQVKLTGCSDGESEVRTLLQCLPYISKLSSWFDDSDELSGGVKFFGTLFCAAAEREQQTGEKTLELLSSVCTYPSFPFTDTQGYEECQCDFLLDLYSHLKDYETETGLSFLPSLQSVLQSAPVVWIIDLSERKTSLLLEVLRLQPEKKQVKLTGCSDGESEVRTLLQCLPYISKLSFVPQSSEPSGELQFFGTLFCAAGRAQQTGEKTLLLLLSVCTYQTITLTDIVSYYFKRNPQCDFLLDLYSHLKDYETETGLSVLPSLKSVLQSAPAVWFIDLSERKTSILLEVLRLQPEKKQVELTGCSDEESEVRTLLQCLPYISKLSYCPWIGVSGGVQFFGTLFCAAAEREQQTGEKTLELLSSVCTHPSFPLPDKQGYEEYQSGFLLDLYSHLKDYETESGLSVLPSLQSVLQSAPAVWFIDLSERKTSILLEVLRLQPEKKQVELTGCSGGESEVRTLLQCLPYISQLSFVPQSSEPSGELQFFGTLFCAAAEREQQTGEKKLLLLLSVCTYQTITLTDIVSYYFKRNPQCDFLLDLASHLKDYETETGLSVLPLFQSVLQSAPEVWTINLSQRKTSILLEVLRLQPEKKQVKLRGCSDGESEVRTLLQCLPDISKLSSWFRDSGGVKFFGTLFCAAAEREQQTGEKTLELLSSVCTYPRFPLTDKQGDDDDDEFDYEEYQSDFLLDLYSHLKDYETETGLSFLPSLQSVLQSAPAVWIIDLSQRKSSILLEVLRLQPEKKQVELTGCSDGESEVRTLLQCLPYISQISCDPEFFQRVSTFISVRSREEAERLASLLQLSGFTLLLSGELPRKTCLSVGRVLQLCGSKVDLILKPRKMSVKGAFALFRRTTQLHSLKLSNDMALLLGGWVRRWGVVCQVTVEELSLSPQTAQPSHRVLLKVVSSLASLLRYWAVRQLDLTEVCVPALGLTPLLLHDGPLKIKLSEKNVQQLLSLLHELQDEDLTWSFLSKLGGDLTSFSLNWELLHLLLQHPSAQTLTVNMRKNLFLQENVTRLLPYLDRIVFKRPCPSFVLTAIREIYKARASSIIPSLLRSLDHVINLTCREMSSVDCDALLYTLTHSDGVKLNLLWTSIPAWKTQSILLNLDKVSQLSVDRNLLLRMVHGCAASDAQQGAAESLLRTVQHRLDLSCSSCVELPEEDQSDTLRLTAEDCRAVSTILTRSRRGTQLILQDCEVQDSGLELLFPVLHKVKLRASKAVLLQLVSLVAVNSERDTVGRAVSLCKALEGELDLSHSSLDQRACAALALMLDFSEELTELDLSHCQLTDQLLLTLSAQLHKVQVLDLSHNNITDASTDLLLQLVSINPSIHSVRLFENNIVERTSFEKDKKFEIW